jgi:hypothetical protein
MSCPCHRTRFPSVDADDGDGPPAGRAPAFVEKAMNDERHERITTHSPALRIAVLVIAALVMFRPRVNWLAALRERRRGLS